ncbi:uncharacterized protein LOC128641871 [Bombina bombina]|uniref:uncharacterized protein LOC128641871 n=1 Tax=Bombina bombina TaxID=8345 RepID=UPI00235AF37B|nr:uncharacterized protein LOC128641871 [Bombina bombina]
MDHHNMTYLYYPSQTMDSYSDLEDIIAYQNVISRAMHTYIGILLPLGLLSGIFCTIIIIKNNIRSHIFENLDFYILNLTITDITITLYSFTVITRPDYLEITNVSCSVLASFFNLSYFYSQYLLVLMLPMFVIFSNSISNIVVTKARQSPLVCVCVTLAVSLLLSLLAMSLMGTYWDPDNITHCQFDPLNSKPAYDFVKFTAGFCIPSIVIVLFLGFLIALLKSAEDTTIKKNVKEHLVVLLHISVLFTCRLFYNIMLLRRTQLKLLGDLMSPGDELITNIAELVMLSGSCINLIFTLTLHRPCRLGVWNSLQFIKNKCCGTRNANEIEMEGPSNEPLRHNH